MISLNDARVGKDNDIG